MNCKETQHNLYNFINGQLPEEELEDFIQHVTCCRECYEELEIYFTLSEGMKRLDQMDNISINYHDELNSRLKKQQHHIVFKRRLIRYSLILGAFLCFCGFTLGWIEKSEFEHAKNLEITQRRGQYYYYNEVKDIMYEHIHFNLPAIKENEYD